MYSQKYHMLVFVKIYIYFLPEIVANWTWKCVKVCKNGPSKICGRQSTTD